MTKSKVFFADRDAQVWYNMLDKLEHVFMELGLTEAIKPGYKVMIKTHFGQFGNTNYLRPVYVRKLVDLVRAAGGIPFVTESCGLGYGGGGAYGGRTTAPEYLAMAALNGFTEGTVGAPLIMVDGYWGTDIVDVEVEGTDHIKSVDVAAAVFDSDLIIVLTHAKGHGLSGLGGSLKNIGIGLVGKRGKAAMHFVGPAKVDMEKCIGPECSKCLKVCPVGCISMSDKAEIDTDRCILCGHCQSVCNNAAEAKAINLGWRPTHEQSPRFVENALGVLKSIGSEKFYFINMAIDISDKCDCWNVGAALLVHDIGIFGSKDPLAVDQACLDAINEAHPNPDSMVSALEVGDCKFAAAHDHKDPETGDRLQLAEIQFAHAKKLGIGSREYELVTLTKEKPGKK